MMRFFLIESCFKRHYANASGWPCAKYAGFLGFAEMNMGVNGRPNGAGEGNRTLVVSLGSFCSTIELHPQTVDKSEFSD